MSLILGIDTATADTVAAVTPLDPSTGAGSGRPRVELRLGAGENGRPQHARAALALAEEAVAEAGGWERISRIACGVGPGSFTGIRIGVATARALAQARSLPITPVVTTTALAAGGPADRDVVAVIDARRGEVFVGVRPAGVAVASDPELLAPDDLEERLGGLAAGGGTPLAIGDGAVRFRAELEALGIEVPADADPRHGVSAAQICAVAGSDPGSGRLEDVRPLYLRRPDAERWRERNGRD